MPNSKLFEQFMRVAETVTFRLPWQAESVAEHRAWRPRFKRKLKELLGRMPEPVPLEVEWAERVETDAFVRHKVYVRAEDDYWVPAYSFVPHAIRDAAPAVVCLHGHSGIMPYIREGDEHDLEKMRHSEVDFAPLFAEHGYITIAPVQRGWNETMHKWDSTVAQVGNSCRRVTLDALMIGMTALGLRVWDNMRVIDFLHTRDEVDAARIGAAGISGGGAISLFLSALDDRVKLSMVSGFYCTFKASIYRLDHCICNVVPHIMEWGDMREVAALIAPRPLLTISGSTDHIFPIKATKSAYRELGRVYKLLGARRNLESDFFEGGHRWSNRKTLPFLARHFGRPC